MRKIIFTLALLLALSTAGCAGASTDTAIQASGLIEAKEIVVAPELSGRVTEVTVSEGDPVRAGDPLLRLDDSLLLAEKQAALAALDTARAGVRAGQAALDSAQAQYDLMLSAALASEQSSRRNAWRQSKPGRFDQPVWYFSKGEKLASAQAEVNAAREALDEARARLNELESRTGTGAFLETEKRLSDARTAFRIARLALDQTRGASDRARLHEAAQTVYDNAETDLINAQNDYEEALTTDGARDILEARANVEVAQEYYLIALDELRALQTGESSLSVVAAGKAVDQARAALDQVRSAVSSAQANLDLLNTQVDKLTLRAPLDGVVLVRSIEAGEVIQAGMPALTIGKLDMLKVTVYIPETEYGQIRLGQQARLSADSFPGQSFHARVTRIADQAEFTPQNVQTREGRQSTVYAIELSVDNPDGKLKPGMPVDVTFEGKSTEN